MIYKDFKGEKNTANGKVRGTGSIDASFFLGIEVNLNLYLSWKRQYIHFKITPNVIFATTTPVNPEYQYTSNAVIEQYNAVLVPKLQALGIKINDLHALVAPNIPEYICEDMLHLSEAGAALCAQQVVKMIKEF